MDYLIKKSDSSIVEVFHGGATKIKLPEQIGGDVVFTGDQRPLDLGDYMLIKAKAVDEDLSETKKRGETEVVVDGETVTITKKAVDKSEAEIAQEKIQTLEATVTQRRVRDSILTPDGKAWLENVESQIASERSKL